MQVMNTEPNERKQSSHINTDGAYIGNDVNTGGGNVIGRDSLHIQQLNINLSSEIYSRSKETNESDRQEFIKITPLQTIQEIEQLLRRLILTTLINGDTFATPIILFAALFLSQIHIIKLLFLKDRSKLKNL